MKREIHRRKFISTAASLTTAALWPGTVRGSGTTGEFTSSSLRKAACIGVLPRELSIRKRFELARSLGFEGIEPNTLNSPEEVEEYREASESTGVRIHSIMNSDHWRYPLTDDDPEVVQRCIEGIKTSMHNARDLGADAVLLVPGIVTARVGYSEVYSRSQEQIRRMLPVAEELNIVIAVENVGNRFLLSPLEFARYVDEFESPRVRAYFDVGNVTSMGFPHDWIRTLGSRLLKVHIKRFEPGVEHPTFDPADRRTQGISWPEVRKALDEVGFKGWVTAEVGTGDQSYLEELSRRIDRIFLGENPG